MYKMHERKAKIKTFNVTESMKQQPENGLQLFRIDILIAGKVFRLPKLKEKRRFECFQQIQLKSNLN